MANITVTNSNLRKATWKNVRQCLVSASITGVSSRIYASYPLKNVVLPLIIIDNTIKGDDMHAVNHEDLTKSITVPITLACKKSEHIDNLIDEIEAALDGYVTTFDTYKLYYDTLLDGDSSQFVDLGGNRAHSKTVTAVFELK